MSGLPLQRGQRLKLSQITGSKQFVVVVNPTSPTLKFDVSCFGLDEAGKLSDERFFVFYNQKSAPNEALKMLGAQNGEAENFWVDLGRLPPSIRRVMWVISVDGAGEMKQMGASYLHFLVGSAGANKWEEGASFAFSGQDLGRERALMVAELYFKDEWRINTIGQGFAGGLDAVLTHFGGEVADNPTPPSPNSAPARPPQPPAPPRQNDGKSCLRCGRPLSLWEKTTGSYNATTGRCKDCENAVLRERADVLVQAQEIFARLCSQPTFDGTVWKNARNCTVQMGIPPDHLLQAIHPTAVQFLQRQTDQSVADGIITQDADARWNSNLLALDLPHEWTEPFRWHWEQEKSLSAIRQGQLPRVQADFHLASDEICHLYTDADFAIRTYPDLQIVPVQLIATNKRLYVLESGVGAKQIPYSRFLRVSQTSNAVLIELSTRPASGTYFVNNPRYVEAVLTALVKINKR